MAKKYTKDFFIQMNMQNPPKPDPAVWYVRKADEESVFEYTVEGWEFTLDRRKDSLGEAEGFSPKLNFRKCFLPEEGHYWVSRDFAGQELRILANLAMEETWIKEFQTGGDPHKATAITLWGEENYSAKMRKAAKAINFGLIYGKTAMGFADDLGISVEEAQSYVDKYFEKLPNVEKFLNKCVRLATKNHEIANMYGRKRRLKSYIDAWNRISNRGQRISYNFPIQSFGAEVTKLALIKVYSGLITVEEYLGKVYFKNTIHDEINVSVEYGIVKEVAFKMDTLMTHNIPGKPVPIKTDLEIGHSMGLLWKFNQDPDTLELTPVYEPFEGEKDES